MKGRTLIVLALVAASLALYIACSERHGKDSAAARAASKRLVRDFAPDKVSALVLQAKGGAKVRVERVAKGWRLRLGAGGKSSARADRARVAALLSAIEFLEPLRSLDSASGRGLDPPRRVLTIERKGEEPLKVELGSRDASGKAVYARFGKQVVVIPARFFRLIEDGADSLRDREVLGLSQREIKSVTITRGGAAVKLARTKRGFRLTHGKLITRAAAAPTQRAFAALASLRARRFGGASITGKAIAATLHIEPAKPGKATPAVDLRLGGDCPGGGALRAVARRVGAKGAWQRVCVDGEDLAPLRGEIAALVKQLADPSLLGPLRLADITRLEIARGKEQVVIRRDGGALLLGEQKKAAGKVAVAADSAAIKALIDAMARHDAAPRLPHAGELAAIDRAWAARLRVTYEGGASEVVTFGTPEGKAMLARRGDEHAVIALPAGALSLLEPDPLRFRSRRVLALSQFEVKSITIVRGNEREQLERDAAGFKVVKPTEVRADRAAVRALLDKLSDLRCSRYLATRAKVGALVIEARAGDKTQRLSLGPAGKGACRGHVEGLPDFELPPKDCALLRRRLARRQLVLLRSSKLTRLSLSRPGEARLSLARDGQQWTLGKQPAKATTVAQLIAAIAALRGEVKAYKQRPDSALRATLRVRHESGKPSIVVRVYGGGDKGALSASDAAYGVTWTLDAQLWQRLEQAFAAAAAP